MLVLTSELPRTAGTGKLRRAGYARATGVPTLLQASGPIVLVAPEGGEPPRAPEVDAARIEGLLEALPCVGAASVVQVGDMGGAAVALVQPQAVDPERLWSYLRVQIASHLMPERVVALDKIPSDDAGRLDAARAALQSAQAEGGMEPPSSRRASRSGPFGRCRVGIPAESSR